MIPGAFSLSLGFKTQSFPRFPWAPCSLVGTDQGAPGFKAPQTGWQAPSSLLTQLPSEPSVPCSGSFHLLSWDPAPLAPPARGTPSPVHTWSKSAGQWGGREPPPHQPRVAHVHAPPIRCPGGAARSSSTRPDRQRRAPHLQTRRHLAPFSGPSTPNLSTDEVHLRLVSRM